MKKIVSFDLDMTLLNHDGYKVPDSAMKALEKLKKAGNLFAISTGRDMSNYYSREYIDLLKPDAVIDSNGTRVKIGDNIIYESLFDKDLLKDLIDFSLEQSLTIGLSGEDYDCYVNNDKLIEHYKKHWASNDRKFKDYKELYNMDVRTLTYIGDADGAKLIEENFNMLKLPMFANLTGADIIHVNDSKAKGLEELAKYLDIDMENTVAFGDSMNDYEILLHAGVGVAMGNADERLKKIADYITDDIGNDGIYKACEALKLF